MISEISTKRLIEVRESISNLAVYCEICFAGEENEKRLIAELNAAFESIQTELRRRNQGK
jgi:hypothetical protein